MLEQVFFYKCFVCIFRFEPEVETTSHHSAESSFSIDKFMFINVFLFPFRVFSFSVKGGPMVNKCRYNEYYKETTMTVLCTNDGKGPKEQSDFV